MSEIIIEEIKSKKPQSDTVKRAKAKYYNKKKLDPEFMEQNRSKAKQYYEERQEKIRYSKSKTGANGHRTVSQNTD